MRLSPRHKQHQQLGRDRTNIWNGLPINTHNQQFSNPPALQSKVCKITLMDGVKENKVNCSVEQAQRAE